MQAKPWACRMRGCARPSNRSVNRLICRRRSQFFPFDGHADAADFADSREFIGVDVIRVNFVKRLEYCGSPMTKLIPDERCIVCSAPLVPPSMASLTFKPFGHADYVCLRCGRPYRWLGSPPRLTVLATAERHDVDHAEDEQ